MNNCMDIDVLIIGGGINGCGTFRDLCAQNIDCLLLERTDFCAGASAASSRLMHGGLKYLETGEFRLVRESAEERNRLLRNAPHYVSPLPSVLPLRSRLGGIWSSTAHFLGLNSRLTDRGSIITRLGLTLYDLYGRNFRVMPNHQMLSRDGLDRTVKGMNRNIIGAGLYYEGQISHAERLGLELVLDGEALNPASRALNHAVIETQVDGIVSYWHDGHHFRVRPRVIINAGGAWIDRVNATLGLNTRLMGGSKGAHLVVDNPKLLAALNGHMVYFGTADGRVNLLYPFMDRVLIGATDIKIDDPDQARCDEEEAAYLRSVVAEVFPDIPVTEDQIRHRFSGVRPLPRSDGKIGMVTRDHSIAELALPCGTPVHCLIGGKWTTFRKFSEEAADRALSLLDRSRKVSTTDMAIGGGKNFPSPKNRADWITEIANESGLSCDRVEELLSRYGSRASEMARSLAGETRLRSLTSFSHQELAWLILNERVETLADLLLRRTPIAISGHLSREVAEESALILSQIKGWDQERYRNELGSFHDILGSSNRTANANDTALAG